MLQYVLASLPLVGGFAIGSTISTSTYDTNTAVGPPKWVFPVMWTILYVLLGYSALRVGFGNQAMVLWWIGLLLNFAWSPLYFGMNERAIALRVLQVLLLTTVLMAVAFYRVDPVAGWLQVPYIVWLAYAHHLNQANLAAE